MPGADAENGFDRLDHELRRAPVLAPELLRQVVEQLGVRISLLRQSGRAVRIDRLIEAGAFTEAALAVIELELPAWKIRRLIYEDGAWLCSLSRQRNLPIALDDPIEAGHEVLPLAILRAFVEACRRRSSAPTIRSTVPDCCPSPDRIIGCDNFA